MDDQKDELKQTINNALIDAFPGVEVQFDPYPGYGKLHGAVIWEGFQDWEQIKRQHQIWNVLRPALTEDQKFATGFLLTVTPAEIAAMQEVAA